MLVVKVGGGKDIDHDAVVDDLVELRGEGTLMVLVHGGAETTNEVATKLGHPPQFVTSESGLESRRTDRRTLEIFEMVYCGQLNKAWVEKLQTKGINAVGLSGLDGRIFEGRRKDKLRIRVNGRRLVLHDDWTGTVDRVNIDLLRLLLSNHYLPVLTPPGSSELGEAINVDGDRAAAAVAVALEADTLLMLSNVPGLLERFPDEQSLISEVDAKDLESTMALAQGRMKKKVLGAIEATQSGVRRVIFGDGRVSHPIKAALAGGGTHVTSRTS